MKKIIFYILCIIPIIISAQSSKNTIGFFITPNYSYRSLSSTYDYLDEIDENAILFDLGFVYKKHLSGNFFIESGLTYSRKGFNRTPITFFSLNRLVNLHKLKYRLDYIGIPLGIEYKLKKATNFNIGISSGINNNFLISASYKPYDVVSVDFITGGTQPINPIKKTYKGKKLKEIGYNIYNPELFFRLNFNYAFEKFIIGISPNYNLSLKEIGKKEYPYYHTESEKLYAFGVMFSISKKI